MFPQFQYATLTHSCPDFANSNAPFRFVSMVSGDAPMSAFLPVRYHAEFLSVLNDLKFGETSSLNTIKDYCSELHQLLKACMYVLRRHLNLFKPGVARCPE